MRNVNGDRALLASPDDLEIQQLVGRLFLKLWEVKAGVNEGSCQQQSGRRKVT